MYYIVSLFDKGNQLRHITSGCLFWITGLSGAGKTSIGEIFTELLRERYDNVVFLDGDELRKIFSPSSTENSYSQSARLSLAYKYARLCENLTRQGQNVVCATISLFPEIWNWNRSHTDNYFEIYVQVPFPILVERNKKGLYHSMSSSENPANVVGIDIPFHPPDTPDLTIINDGSETPSFLAQKIFKFWLSTQ